MPQLNRRQALAAVCTLAAAVDPSRAEPIAEGRLTGAGATFPGPVYERWSAAYQQQTGQAVVYEQVGSGAGLDLFARELVDFGASDRPLDPAEAKRLDAWQFPALIGGVVPVVNLRGIPPGALRLTGDVIARIYLGEIRAWNDPSLVALNPALALPSENITVVHRADASGTSFLWSDFLARKSPAWRSGVGAAARIEWPVGVAEPGNEGVASSVQRTRAAIGYVEYAYARRHGLSDASVENRAGRFVRPSRVAFLAAVASAAWRAPADLAQVLVDQGGTSSWPITGSTFIVLRRHPPAPSRTRALLAFFHWALTHGAEDVVDLDYVAMPAAAIPLIEAAWIEALRRPDGSSLWP